jgi:hypothetical protein
LRRVKGWLAPQGQAGAHGRQQARIKSIGFGVLAHGFGEGAGAAGIDAGVWDGGAAERLAKRGVIDAGSLEHDQVLRGERGRERGDRLGRVLQTPGLAARGVVEVEMMLGDVDSDDKMR